jgi:4-hydroxythreonine-4-phosphate dehydrogenase
VVTKTIAITMGDPAGIGPEIIVKALCEDELNGAPLVVVGCLKTSAGQRAGRRRHLSRDRRGRGGAICSGVIHVIDEPLAQPDALEPGKVQAQAGDLAYRCVRAGDGAGDERRRTRHRDRTAE